MIENVTVIENTTANVYTQEDTSDVYLFQDNLPAINQFTVCMAINADLNASEGVVTFFSASGTGPRKYHFFYITNGTLV